MMEWWLAHPWADAGIALFVSAFAVSFACLLSMAQDIVFGFFND